MDALTIAILGLATWRISSLLVREAGPFFFFRRLRELTGIRHDLDGSILVVPDRFFAGLFSCVWCASVWVGGLLGVAWFLWPKETLLVAAILGLSALAIIIDRLFNGRTLP